MPDCDPSHFIQYVAKQQMHRYSTGCGISLLQLGQTSFFCSMRILQKVEGSIPPAGPPDEQAFVAGDTAYSALCGNYVKESIWT